MDIVVSSSVIISGIKMILNTKRAVDYLTARFNLSVID